MAAATPAGRPGSGSRPGRICRRTRLRLGRLVGVLQRQTCRDHLLAQRRPVRVRHHLGDQPTAARPGSVGLRPMDDSTRVPTYHSPEPPRLSTTSPTPFNTNSHAPRPAGRGLRAPRRKSPCPHTRPCPASPPTTAASPRTVPPIPPGRHCLRPRSARRRTVPRRPPRQAPQRGPRHLRAHVVHGHRTRGVCHLAVRAGTETRRTHRRPRHLTSP